MTFINLITGLIIAAMLHVPGTTQHETTQVGEEPVVMVAVEKMEQTLHWYQTNTAGTHILGSPVFTGTKSQVIAAQSCKDLGGNICLYGSEEDDLPNNMEIESPEPEQTIRRNN